MVCLTHKLFSSPSWHFPKGIHVHCTCRPWFFTAICSFPRLHWLELQKVELQSVADSELFQTHTHITATYLGTSTNLYRGSLTSQGSWIWQSISTRPRVWDYTSLSVLGPTSVPSGRWEDCQRECVRVWGCEGLSGRGGRTYCQCECVRVWGYARGLSSITNCITPLSYTHTHTHTGGCYTIGTFVFVQRTVST